MLVVFLVVSYWLGIMKGDKVVFWGSRWVVSINNIRHVQIKWTWRLAGGELCDFWLLNSLHLGFEAKPMHLSKSKQARYLCMLRPDSRLVQGFWHHKGTWRGRAGTGWQTWCHGRHRTSVHCPVFPDLCQAVWCRVGDRHTLYNKMASGPGLV